MIEEIRIEDLGVIAGAAVRPGPGLTAITGETGAGKTMVLTGLDLLLGGRAETALVRTGAERAVAEGVFVVDPEGPVARRAREAGAEVDEDGTLVIARTLGARSRAHLGGRTVPQAVLAELAEHLVTVHGQSDQVRLRSPRRQREALDAFAGTAHRDLLADYRSVWAERQRAAVELEDLTANAVERAREAELLRLGLAEIERVEPAAGEDVALAEEAERLGHVEEIRAAAWRAHVAVTGSDAPDAPPGAAALVAQGRADLLAAAAHDATLGALAERLAEAGFLLEDVGAELAAHVDGLAADPARLEEVQRRRAELAHLARSHGGSVAAALEWARDAGLRLLGLDGGEDRVADLRARVTDLSARLDGLAARLSAGRVDAAERLAAAVSAELAGLAMAGARLEVALTPAEPGPWGAEDVELLLVPHAGAPARPLGQGASGGELSRVMLAIEVSLAAADDAARPATFVFDEVDAGVGGRAAVEVGRRLSELARGAQVLVVTHLAQVAAFADVHLVVTKSGGAVTVADVAAVTGPDRVAELARMLSGQEDSDAALQHAAELLERSVVGR